MTPSDRLENTLFGTLESAMERLSQFGERVEKFTCDYHLHIIIGVTLLGLALIIKVLA